jgi:hypothetical protein
LIQTTNRPFRLTNEPPTPPPRYEWPPPPLLPSQSLADTIARAKPKSIQDIKDLASQTLAKRYATAASYSRYTHSASAKPNSSAKHPPPSNKIQPGDELEVKLCGLLSGHDSFAYAWTSAHPKGRNHVSKTWWTDCARCGDKAYKGGRRCVVGSVVLEAIEVAGGAPPRGKAETAKNGAAVKSSAGSGAGQGPLPSQEEMFSSGKGGTSGGGGRKDSLSGGGKKGGAGSTRTRSGPQQNTSRWTADEAPDTAGVAADYELKPDHWVCRLCCEELCPAFKQSLWVEVFLSLRSPGNAGAKFLEKVPNRNPNISNTHGASPPVVLKKRGDKVDKGGNAQGAAAAAASDEDDAVYSKETVGASKPTTNGAAGEGAAAGIDGKDREGKNNKGKGKSAAEEAEHQEFLRANGKSGGGAAPAVEKGKGVSEKGGGDAARRRRSTRSFFRRRKTPPPHRLPWGEDQRPQN